METKQPTSNYLEDKYCEQLRELLRDAMGRNVKGKPLPKFYATYQEYEEKLFEIIDKAHESLCGDCDRVDEDNRMPDEPMHNEGYE